MEKVLSLLEVGGGFYTIVQHVHLDAAKDSPASWYQTELVDAAGSDEKVCSWLKKIACGGSRLRVEERLGTAHRADKYPEGLQRRHCPAHETNEVPGGESSWRRFQLEP